MNGPVRIWDIPSDDRPIEDIVKLAELYAFSRIDDTNAVAPLTAAEMRERLAWARVKYPQEFTEPTSQYIRSWRLTQADDAAKAKDAFAEAFHLRILLKETPADEALQKRLAAAENALNRVAPLPRRVE